ncbi:GAF domain-containing protein [Deinococcus altitudinis]|uniref:GAF domain-containing protein n=1 Tax=Deinococcus altitudinis TaxID=468914 RepID=UPI0038921FDF
MTFLPDDDLRSLDPLSARIQEITQALAATSTTRSVIEMILTPAVQALGATAGIVLLVDQTDQQIKIAGSQGYEDVTLTVWQEGPIEDHVLIADILRMKEARYFEDAGALKAAYPDLESRTGALAAVANATLPMFLDQRPLGVIVLDFTEPHTFTPAERRLLAILTDQCAVALGRAEAIVTLETRVEERTRQLQEQARQLEEERAGLAAFMAFTEAVGTQTDVAVLAREAVKILQGHFRDASIGYYRRDQELWTAQAWSEDLAPEVVEVITAGVTSEHPVIAEVLAAREAVFDYTYLRAAMVSPSSYWVVGSVPLTLGGEVCGLLSVGFRTIPDWSEQDRQLLRAVARGLNLALERSEQTRQLQDERAALDAFAQFTEAVGAQSDLLALAGEAIATLRSRFPDASVGCHAEEGGLWQAQLWSDNVPADLVAQMRAGFPAGTPMIAQALRAQQVTFTDAWDARRELIERSGKYSAVANYPLVLNGECHWLLSVGRTATTRWQERDKAIVRAVGRGLNLAMERSEQTRQLELEQASLSAFTAFSEMVGTETDVDALIRQAARLLQQILAVDVAHFWREGEVFRVEHASQDFPPELLARSRLGFTLDQLPFDRALLQEGRRCSSTSGTLRTSACPKQRSSRPWPTCRSSGRAR